MKKTFLLSLVCIFSLTIYAQDLIPNFSFEDWTVSPALPQNWEVYNDSALVVSSNAIQRRTGGSHGNYSLRLNSYQGSPFVRGAAIETYGTLTTTPKSISFDYFNQTAAFSLSGLYINLYFYDSADEYLIDYSWSPSENNGSAVLTPSRNYLGFPSGTVPKYYTLEIKMSNFNGPLSEYCVIDNIKFSNIASGIEESKESNLKVIYPNPTKGILGLRNMPSNTSIAHIIGLDGQEILTKEIAENYEVIDIAGVADGLYFLRLEDKNGNVIGTQKFIKNTGL